MGAMIMNMAANILGIGNAATPFGLRAMRELQKLNAVPGVATNAMCTFLAINTSSIQAIPANTVALLAAAGSTRPSAIIGTTFLATLVSTIVAIIVVKLLQRFPGNQPRPEQAAPAPVRDILPVEPSEPPVKTAPLGLAGKATLLVFAAFIAWVVFKLTFPATLVPEGSVRLVPGTNAPAGAVIVQAAVVSETDASIVVRTPEGVEQTHAKSQFKEIVRPQSTVVRAVNAMSVIAIPGMLAFFVIFAALKKVKVYENFIEGAKEGFNVVVTIIPYAVSMLVAIFMFRASGCIDVLTNFLRPLMSAVGFPPEILPLGLIRPLSTSGANAVLIDLCKTFGADHLLSRTAATIMGSSETTFYVIAVYFGSVGIRRTRHAVPAGIIADLTGVVIAVIICRAVFQP